MLSVFNFFKFPIEAGIVIDPEPAKASPLLKSKFSRFTKLPILDGIFQKGVIPKYLNFVNDPSSSTFVSLKKWPHKLRYSIFVNENNLQEDFPITFEKILSFHNPRN